MAKTITLVLLFAAAALVSANGSIDLSIAHGDKTANGSVTTSVHDLSKQLAAAALIAHGNLDGCECGQQCQDEIKEKCTPKVVTETVCQNVTKESEVTECKTKCYTADKVVEIGVPTIGLNHGRRMLGVVPVMKDDGSLTFTHPLASSDGKGKEFCKEICAPVVKSETKEECEDQQTEKKSCKDEVVGNSCKTVCKCGDKVTVEIKEKSVPDYSAVAKMHPGAAIAAALLESKP